MKKYLAFVLALVMALSLVACGNKTAEEPSGDGDATEAAGRVFWLNFKPEADGTLQKVAAMYTEKTGVPVTIQTAASGTYNETLTAAMDKESASHDVRRRQPGRRGHLGRLLLRPDRHPHRG